MIPFKVGDKVKIKEDLYGFLGRAGFKLNTIYTVGEVNRETYRISVKETLGCLHYTHFDFYKEEKDMTQQTQQKTKRVPFTHELWEKWKDKGGKMIYTPTGMQVLQLAAYFPEADHRYRYVFLTCPGTLVKARDLDDLALEIPVTSKRIPFNPELKDAKVFYGDTELIEWVQMNSGVVCGSYDTGGIDGVITNLYRPNDLQMEIEE